jgi:broad specificity phosphatase PhoE
MPPADRADSAFFGALPRDAKFYLIRHGESEGNAQGRVQGRIDSPLTRRGREQAADLGEWLRDKAVKTMVASPLSRALETARIAAATAGIPSVRGDGLFVEIDAGSFSGLTMAEAERLHPSEYASFVRESWEAVPGAERAAQLYGRAMDCWGALRAEAAESGGDVVAVTHGGMIQWLIRVTFGLRSWMPIFSAHNCGVFLLDVRPGAAGSPAYMNWRLVNFVPGPGAAASRPDPSFVNR